MRIEDYPSQEPFSEMAMSYVAEIMQRGAGIDGQDHSYGGGDPYQGISLHVPAKPNGTVFAFVHGGGWISPPFPNPPLHPRPMHHPLVEAARVVF